MLLLVVVLQLALGFVLAVGTGRCHMELLNDVGSCGALVARLAVAAAPAECQRDEPKELIPHDIGVSIGSYLDRVVDPVVNYVLVFAAAVVDVVYARIDVQ